MKPIAGSVLFGVVLACVVVYWLRPLNAGATGLVVVVCIGLGGVLGSVVQHLRRRKKSTEDDDA